MNARIISSAIAAALSVALVACADNDDDDGDDTGAYVVTKDERAAFVPASDTAFIDGMVPHHEMAIMMADMQLEHGASEEVMALAASMKEAQQREIDQMKAIRGEIEGSEQVPMLDDPHMDADMQKMEGAHAEEMDRLFLEDMMPHHAGAILMAHNALPNLENEELRSLAMMIIEAQAVEIGVIRSHLDKL